MDRRMAELVVRAREIWKSYDGREDVLCGVDLDVAAAEAVLVAGPNGSGETKLLSILGGPDTPRRGSLFGGGRENSPRKGSPRAQNPPHDGVIVFPEPN